VEKGKSLISRYGKFSYIFYW